MKSGGLSLISVTVRRTLQVPGNVSPDLFIAWTVRLYCGVFCWTKHTMTLTGRSIYGTIHVYTHTPRPKVWTHTMHFLYWINREQRTSLTSRSSLLALTLMKPQTASMANEASPGFCGFWLRIWRRTSDLT